MSNNENYPNPYGNGNYTQRQMADSFHGMQNPYYQQQQQQQAFYTGQQQQLWGQPEFVPSSYDPNMPMMQSYYDQQSTAYSSYQYLPESNIPLQMNNLQPTLPMRAEAPSFSPASTTSNSNEVQAASSQPATSIGDPETQAKPVIYRAPSWTSENSEAKPTTSTDSFVYDLGKYKYDYFISRLSGDFDVNFRKFGSPSGICSVDNDRLLVSNYDLDTLVLFDLNGVVSQLYRQLPAPKDVQLNTKNPSQAVVATKKEVVLLDLTTSKVVVRTNLRGFYPWNIQYIEHADTIAACDPSGERILYFDKDLRQLGEWSFNEQVQQSSSSRAYQKVYPYAARFLSDDTAVVLTNRENKCHLAEKDVMTGETKAVSKVPPGLQAYSIFVDSAKKWLIPDRGNQCLVSFDKGEVVNKYKFKSIQAPYALTFLANGTLCVTDWNKSFGTSGGVAIISETELKANS